MGKENLVPRVVAEELRAPRASKANPIRDSFHPNMRPSVRGDILGKVQFHADVRTPSQGIAKPSKLMQSTPMEAGPGRTPGKSLLSIATPTSSATFNAMGAITDQKIAYVPSEKIRVFLRIRPSPSEPSSYVALRSQSDSVLAVRPKEAAADSLYTFDHIFPSETDQNTIFEETAHPLVSSFISGESGLLFAYGVTNAGKTYTVIGNEENPGLLPRMIESAFQELKQAQAETRDLSSAFSDDSQSSELRISISYLEIYENKIYDLLAESKHQADFSASVAVGGVDIRPPERKNLKLYDNSGRPFVGGLTEQLCANASEAMALLKSGREYIQVHQTALNSQSSRSHGIFTMKLVKVKPSSSSSSSSSLQAEEISRLSIVDLAGSERSKRTNNTGERQQEANNINMSLMRLGDCFEVMRYNQSFPNKEQRKLPYRDTKLTRLFYPYFEGGTGTKIVMIANVSPSSADLKETQSSLKFAAIARDVQIASKIDTRRARGGQDGAGMSEELESRLKEEVSVLQEMLADAEKRVTQTEARVRDEVAQEYSSLMAEMESEYRDRMAQYGQMSESKWSKRMAEVQSEALRRATASAAASSATPAAATEALAAQKREIESLRRDLTLLQARSNTMQAERDLARQEFEEFRQSQEESNLAELEALQRTHRETCERLVRVQGQLESEAGKRELEVEEFKKQLKAMQQESKKWEKEAEASKKRLDRMDEYEKFTRERLAQEKENDISTLRKEFEEALRSQRGEMEAKYELQIKDLVHSLDTQRAERSEMDKELQELKLRYQEAVSLNNTAKMRDLQKTAAATQRADSPMALVLGSNNSDARPVLHQQSPAPRGLDMSSSSASSSSSDVRHAIHLPQNSKVVTAIKESHLMSPDGKPRFRNYEVESRSPVVNSNGRLAMMRTQLFKGGVEPSISGSGVSVTFNAIEEVVSEPMTASSLGIEGPEQQQAVTAPAASSAALDDEPLAGRRPARAAAVKATKKIRGASSDSSEAMSGASAAAAIVVEEQEKPKRGRATKKATAAAVSAPVPAVVEAPVTRSKKGAKTSRKRASQESDSDDGSASESQSQIAAPQIAPASGSAPAAGSKKSRKSEVEPASDDFEIPLADSDSDVEEIETPAAASKKPGLLKKVFGKLMKKSDKEEKPSVNNIFGSPVARRTRAAKKT